MAEFRHKVEAAKLIATLRGFPVAFERNMQKSFKQVGVEFDRRMLIRTGHPYHEGASRGRNAGLQGRTGGLQGSFGIIHPVPGRLAGKRVVNYTTSKIANIHEFGGTIRPKKKFLTIPTRFALTERGGPKGGTRIRKVGNRWVTRDGNKPTFIAKNTIFIDNGKGKKPTPIKWLVRKVTIKPRLGMFSTFAKMRRKFIPITLDNGLNRAMKEAQ